MLFVRYRIKMTKLDHVKERIAYSIAGVALLAIGIAYVHTRIENRIDEIIKL
jgi:hypothetical protein